MPEHPLIFVHGTLALGGAEQLRVSVLRELVRTGLRPRVCVLRHAGPLAADVRSLGVPVDVLGIRGSITDLRGTFRLASYFREHRPRIVQASQFVTNCLSIAAAGLAGVPLTIIEEHGHYTWKRWYHRFLDRRICSRADAVVCCSRSVARFAQGILRVPDAKMHVFHNCVDDRQLRVAAAGAAGIRRELNAAPDTLLVGCIGTLRWEKGHRHLLDAWRNLHEQRRIPGDARLLIVGDGPLREELRAQAASLPGVRFLGARRDIGAILHALDAFVLPSVSEGLGIALLEAMFCGVPVIATRTGGIPEVVAHHEHGLLVPPGDSAALADALGCLLGDAGLRERLGGAAQPYAAERFAAEAYAGRLVNLYQEQLALKAAAITPDRTGPGARRQSACNSIACNPEPLPPGRCH